MWMYTTRDYMLPKLRMLSKLVLMVVAWNLSQVKYSNLYLELNVSFPIEL